MRRRRSIRRRDRSAEDNNNNDVGIVQWLYIIVLLVIRTPTISPEVVITLQKWQSIDTCTYICTYAYTHLYIYIYIYIYVCVCVCV